MPQIMASLQEGKEQDLQPAGWAAFSDDDCHFLRGMQNSQHLLLNGGWGAHLKNSSDIYNVSDCE